jgi:hypothetical protein
MMANSTAAGFHSIRSYFNEGLPKLQLLATLGYLSSSFILIGERG